MGRSGEVAEVSHVPPDWQGGEETEAYLAPECPGHKSVRGHRPLDTVARAAGGGGA